LLGDSHLKELAGISAAEADILIIAATAAQNLVNELLFPGCVRHQNDVIFAVRRAKELL